MLRKNALYEGHGFSRAVNVLRAGGLLAPGVRVSMLRSARNLPFNSRTSAAKAAHASKVYDTAEAASFVSSLLLENPGSNKPLRRRQRKILPA
jgi:hypothetical protein